jgi:hypothetical protein
MWHRPIRKHQWSPSLVRPTVALASLVRPTLERLEDRTVPGFLGPVNYAVGSNPLAVATGDFNGDGRADLVTANSDKGSVSVLSGNGDGTFQAARTFRAGVAPFSVVVGDLNGDGKMDIVTANANDVSALLAQADGNFQAAKPIDVGGNPLSVAVGDFNADGMLDLAVTSQASSYWSYFSYTYDFFWQSFERSWTTTGVRSVLLGHGDGTFASPVSSVTGETVDFEQDTHYLWFWSHYTTSHSDWGDIWPTWAAVGDFDGDARLDAVLGSRSATGLVVLPGDGAGGFTGGTSLATASIPRVTAVGDLNGDGMLDLVTLTGNNATVFLGNGDRTFRPARDYPAGVVPNLAAIADLNGDHIQDLVTAAVDGKRLNVLLGNGDGSFRTPISSHSDGPVGLAIANLNADGLPDVVTANSHASAVSILINDGAWPAMPPAVAAFRVNNGSHQRSMVTGLSLTFSDQVTLDPGAFVVTPSAGGPPVPMTVSTSVVGGVTVATLTFPGILGGSLPDGDWVLQTVASKVRNSAGVFMAADRTDTFFRLFGDVTGDRTVNGSDLTLFRAAFGSAFGDARYVAALDYDGDGVINGADLAQFRAHFGTILP